MRTPVYEGISLHQQDRYKPSDETGGSYLDLIQKAVPDPWNHVADIEYADPPIRHERTTDAN